MDLLQESISTQSEGQEACRSGKEGRGVKYFVWVCACKHYTHSLSLSLLKQLHS